MFKEFPKALYKGGAWDGVSEPDCVTVGDMSEQAAQEAFGYFPIGGAPSEQPAAPKVDRRRKEFRNAASSNADQ